MGTQFIDKKSIKLNPGDLKSYLEKRRALIMDSGVSTGRALRKFLMQYGSQSESITVCTDFEIAKKEILASPVHILICELNLNLPNPLELIQLHDESFSNRLEVASILMCSDPSAASSGMIIESSADSMIIKPLNQKSFEDAIFQALANKVTPSSYWQTLEKGKELLKQDDLDTAITLFEKAKSLDSHPTLCFYYLGRALEKKEDYQGAMNAYRDGLSLNSKDYRCLMGLFDAHLREKTFDAAYDLAKRIHEVYPVNANRLLDLVHLSVRVKKFSDVTDYYSIFKSSTLRDPKMGRLIVAAMLVCSKYFFICNDKKRCVETLNEASKVAMESGVLQPEVLRYCIETENFDFGVIYHSKLSELVLEQSETKLLYVELMYKMGDFDSVLKFGMPLSQSSFATPKLLDHLISASRLQGRSDKAIEPLIELAKLKKN